MLPIDFNELDTTVHGPVRLGILTALQMDGPHDFTTLRKRLKVSDGALGMHLQTLENQGYIVITKAFVGKRPRTTYRLTSKGRRALVRYLDAMRKLLDAMTVSKTSALSG
jgi:DNA-binding PadR family transcriptional regulator